MKTRIHSLASYQDAPIQQTVDLGGLEDYINKNIKHATRQFKEKKQVQDVQKGDIVTLSLQSEHPKYDRPSIQLTVGSKMFDAELESKIIGFTVHSQENVILTQATVKVEVLESLRLIFPKLTDEMLQEYVKNQEELEGIQTVEAYKEYLTQKYKEEQYEKTYYENIQAVIDYVMTHSDWDFDEEEIVLTQKEYLSGVEEELASQGKTLESLTNQDLQRYFGVKDKEEFYQVLHNTVEYEIAYSVYILHMHQKDPAEHTKEEAFQLGHDFIEEFVKSKMLKLF